jgi:hypothetical protein
VLSWKRDCVDIGFINPALVFRCGGRAGDSPRFE